MTDRSPASDRERERIRALYGMPVRQVSVEPGNELRIEFGTPERAAALTTIGSVWRWESADRMIVASGDDHDVAVAALAGLVGRTLTGVRTQRPALTVRLAFDDDTFLVVFPVTSQDWEHWTLAYPDGRRFTAGPGTDAGWDEPDGS